MSVYYIISYNIENPGEYQKYPLAVLPLFRKYGAEIIVSDTNALTIEGEPKTMNAVVKFPSKQAALSCYNDPEYQLAKKLRVDTTSHPSIVLAAEYINPEN